LQPSGRWRSSPTEHKFDSFRGHRTERAAGSAPFGPRKEVDALDYHHHQSLASAARRFSRMTPRRKPRGFFSKGGQGKCSGESRALAIVLCGAIAFTPRRDREGRTATAARPIARSPRTAGSARLWSESRQAIRGFASTPGEIVRSPRRALVAVSLVRQTRGRDNAGLRFLGTMRSEAGGANRAAGAVNYSTVPDPCAGENVPPTASSSTAPLVRDRPRVRQYGGR